MGWSEEIVQVLTTFKAGGMGFAEAWEKALLAVPPRGREFVETNRGQLFTERDADEPDPLEFMRAACEDAWDGLQPSLAHFSAEMLVGVGDDSKSARAA